MDGLPQEQQEVGSQGSRPPSLQFFSLCHGPESMGAGHQSVRLPSRTGEGIMTGVLSSQELEPREGTFFSFRLALNLFTSKRAVAVLALGVSVSEADMEHLLQMIQNPDLLTLLLLLRIPLWRAGPAVGVCNKDCDAI